MVFENASATKHAMRPGQLLSTFAEKTAAEISDICSAYLSSLGEASVLPLACLAVMGLCLLAVSVRRRALYRPVQARSARPLLYRSFTCPVCC